jgi:hypothetical protein
MALKIDFLRVHQPCHPTLAACKPTQGSAARYPRSSIDTNSLTQQDIRAINSLGVLWQVLCEAKEWERGQKSHHRRSFGPASLAGRGVKNNSGKLRDQVNGK